MAKKLDYSKEIIGLVKSEKENYETASQEIRNKIKRGRANYMCEFDVPTNSKGKKKKFVPLTRWEVDTIASKVFVNERAVAVLPENEKSTMPSLIGDQVLKYQIKNSRFPTQFRNATYDLVRDGTVVFAAFWDFKREVEEVDVEPTEQSTFSKIKSAIFKKKKKTEKRTKSVLQDAIGFSQIDLLNCWIDPTANSIQDAPSFITKNTYKLSDIRSNSLYAETAKSVVGVKTKTRDEYDATSTMQQDIGQDTVNYEIPMVNVYSRWGDFPKSYITGNPDDANIMIRNGVIEIADLYDGKATILRVAPNPYDHKMKPFEECWLQKVSGRWYGIGVGEKSKDIQSSVNKDFNRKEENEDMLHSSMFVVRRGSNIDARSIRSVPGGVILADDINNDIRQLEIRDISQLANSSLQFLFDLTERINGANQISTGSAADRSATTSIIKDRNADTRFAAVRGNINDFLIRYFKLWLKLDRQFLTQKFVLRVTGDDVDFKLFDSMSGLDKANVDKNLLPGYRFIEVDPDDIRHDFDLEADIDQSQPQNKAENAQRILQGMQVGKQLQLNRDYEKLYDAYLDNIGLTGLRFKTRIQQPTMMGMENLAPAPAPNTQNIPPAVAETLMATQVPEQPGTSLPTNMINV